MKTKRILSALLAAALLLAMIPAAVAATASNTSRDTAITVTDGETVTVVADQRYVSYWYKMDVPKAGQFIRIESTGDNPNGYSPSNEYISYSHSDGGAYYYTAQEAGMYYFYFHHSAEEPKTYTVTFTLLDENDANEPNSTTGTATLLTSGKAVDFVLGYGDRDCFSIETTKDAQDVAIAISGFTYENPGSFYGLIDGEIHFYEWNSRIDENGTWYFHFAEAGVHTIELYGYYWYDSARGYTDYSPAEFTITATVLNGDASEPNDTRENAVLLPVGTDTTFSLGGKGDEDWFTFESVFEAGEDQSLYTLNIMDLNTDYSDEMYYDLYAPDGTLLMERMYVNIRHANVLACTQEGLYTLRVYRTNSTSPRSDLRIRVDEGGTDPHEANDTWLDAALVQTNQPVQFVLSSSADYDWFKFEVSEADMTLVLASETYVTWNLYSAAELQEKGVDAAYLQYSSGSSTWYYKFTDPGTYYVRLNTDTTHASQDIRTITFGLEAARDAENNDTWKKATPIYNGVPVSFDSTAWNDQDWFVFEVPEGSGAVDIYNTGGYMYLYRARDFEFAGDNADYIASGGYGHWGVRGLAAGTYYLRGSASRAMNRTLRIRLASDAPGKSIATAQPLERGVWRDVPTGGWFSLGELKAGDEVRVYGERLNSLNLYNAAGERIDYTTRATYGFSVPADGEYYLDVSPSSAGYDADGDSMARLLCDVGTRELTEDEAAGIEVDTEIEMTVGQTVYLTPRMTPSDARLSFEGFYCATNNYNSDLLVSCNSYNTAVTAQKVGTASIRIEERSSGIKINITVRISNPVAAESIAIENAPGTLPLGQIAQLTAVLSDGATEGYSWSSSDPSVLYVNTKGEVTAVGGGSADITVTTDSGVAASVTIAVTDAPAKMEVTGVTLDDYDLTIYMGEGAVQLTATVKPADSGVSASWTSSNPAAATVDQTGKVTPVAPGVTVITAAAGDYRASCVVTVQGERVRVESIAFNQTVLEIPLGGQTTLVPIFAPVDATVKSVTWVSSDPNVASVSRTGIVNALAVGETTITATTLDGGKQAVILIRVTAAPQLGDVNGDGYIDAADAMMCLQAVVGKIALTAEQEQAADVTGDGWVDAADAVRILRYDAGLIDSLQG